MAIGLARGVSTDNQEDKQACYILTEAFLNRFTELHGDMTCTGLLGLDLGDPAQAETAREENLFSALCPVFVSDATRIAAEILGIQ